MSRDAQSADAGVPLTTNVRGRYWWVRWAVFVVVAIVLTVEAVLVWDQLAKAWHSVLAANWWWVLAGLARR